jgi:hypothetical protein
MRAIPVASPKRKRRTGETAVDVANQNFRREKGKAEVDEKEAVVLDLQLQQCSGKSGLQMSGPEIATRAS